MKRRRFWLIKPVNLLLMVISVLMAGVLFFVDQLLFWICAPIVLVLVAFCGYKLWRIQLDLYRMITSMGRSMTDEHEGSLINFPLPSIIVSDTDEVVWYNDMFRETVLAEGKDIFGYDVGEVFHAEIEDLIANQGTVVEYNGRNYETYCLKTLSEGNAMFLLYLVDITELYQAKLLAAAQKPAVLLILIDNYDDSINSENEGNKDKLLWQVRGAIQEFIDRTSGFIRKLGNDRYLAVVEYCDLERIVKNRFDLLDRVRHITTESSVPVTLSIGAAPVTQTLFRAEQDARQALDMALGRGGDQAALKTESGYEFFGGFSKGVEKRTKVKTRIVASALVELIKSSDNVLIMGHKFADLDALGSGIGMAKACQTFGKRVNIVVDSRRNLADVLIQRLVENGDQQMICLPESADDLVNDRTLLIIVDTHTENLVESKPLYHKCRQVVVIDHHRKMVNHIDDAVIFYHEPYASSASEMVAELVQYFGDDCRLGRMEAEAMLSGIMLDTKNFAMKTGARTFEAAAYLRRLGADTVVVRQMFASSMDSYQRKARVVSSAEIYKSCAIATSDFVSDDLRVIASQAADELLLISGVKASFVLFEINDTVNISARSLGALNVQVIMEKLGGGGHQTMAAAQVQNMNYDKVRQTLLEAIDNQQEQQKGA